MSTKIENLDNLIKNFYIFGIEPEDINLTELETNYSKTDIIQIKLLSKFPPIKSENYPIIDPKIIISHCFPNGIKLKSSENNINEHEFFHFSLKNIYQTKSEDEILYFTCCIFYENLKDYITIKNIKKNENNSYDKNSIFIPKLICLNSFYPFPAQYKLILKQLITYSKSKEIKAPIEKIIENIILGIPAPKNLIFIPEIKNNILTDSKIYFNISDINKVRFNSYKMQLIYTFKTDDILEIYKWIILEQPVLFFSENKELLTNIFGTFINLLFPFKYQGSQSSILPDNNAGIIEEEDYFIFGINEKWEEKKEGNESKIFNYFTRLNLNLFKSILLCDIDNKKIFIFKQYAKLNTIYNNHHKNSDFGIKIVSVPDNNNSLSIGEICKLPQKYTEKLKNKLNKNTQWLSIEEYSEEINQKIAEVFFYFLVSILKDYNEYLYNNKNEIIAINELFSNKNIKNINLDNLFLVNPFLKKAIEKNDDPLFFKALFKTDLFKNFLFRKYQNSEKDKYDFLLFDETIIMKKNKNELFQVVKTQFINSKDFATNNHYICDEEKNFENYELKTINSKKEKLIDYYQKYEENQLSYYIFPKLLYDDKFFETTYEWETEFDREQLNELYSKYEKIQNEIKKINYFKIYEGALVNRYNYDKSQFPSNHEMKNNVGYLWLSIFCFTFYYCDDIDKNYKFQELLDNLKKFENFVYHKKIINYVFMTLINYGNDRMIIKFNDYLKHLNLINYDFYNILCNKMIIEESQKEKIKNNLILKNVVVGNTDISFNYFKDKNEDELIMKSSLKKSNKKKEFYVTKRTLHSTDNNEKKVLVEKKESREKEKLEEIQFGSYKCPFCYKEINFAKLLEINNSKRRELSCTNCQKLSIPKCKVKVGDFSTNCRILHPYYLYNDIALGLIKKFGTKIDLDLLKEEYSDFYWSCILYFSFCGYSFDMLIKYKND